MAPKILWIGLGNMGRGMVSNIVQKAPFAEPLVLHNRTRARSEAFRSTLPDPSRVAIAESLEAAVSAADIIFTCLADDPAVNSTVDAVLAAGVSGKVLVDCSTVHPETTTGLGRRVTAAGADFVAAPVFGAPAMADVGQLIAVLAGARGVVDRVRPYFKGATCGQEIDLSDESLPAEASWARASQLKVLGNTFVLNMVEQLAQGLAAAEKSGLGTGPLLSFVEAVFPGAYAGVAHQMVSGDYHKREEPLFAVDLARKDLRHARAMTEAAGVKMAFAEAADRQLARVKERQAERGDMVGIYGAVREEAGLEFENS